MRKGISHCISASFRLSLLPDPSALPRGDISQAPLPGTPHTQTGTAFSTKGSAAPMGVCQPRRLPIPHPSGQGVPPEHGWSVPSRRGPFRRVRVQGAPPLPDPHLPHPRSRRQSPFPSDLGRQKPKGGGQQASSGIEAEPTTTQRIPPRVAGPGAQ